MWKERSRSNGRPSKYLCIYIYLFIYFLMVYLQTLSINVALNDQKECGRTRSCCNVAVHLACLDGLAHPRKSCLGSLCSNRDLNWTPPKWKPEALPVDQTISFKRYVWVRNGKLFIKLMDVSGVSTKVWSQACRFTSLQVSYFKRFFIICTLNL